MIVVIGAETDVGRRVVSRLRAALGHDQVRDLGMAGGDLPSECGAVVLAAYGDHDALAARRRSAVAGLGDLLTQASSCGVEQMVLVSSAMVYGAWPNNPVPLTEEALLRPNHEFAFARQLASAELILDTWRRDVPGRRVAVLRPAPAMAADGTSSVIRALAAGYGLRAGEDDAPCQFVHLDDVADAVVLAVVDALDGVFNLAPDGSIDSTTLRALSGRRPRLRLPGRVADISAPLRWRFQRGPIPPGLRPYTRWPWLVASDGIRAKGWRPTATHEQVYVEGTEARWWTMLTPQRKQELALAVAGLIGVLVMMVGARWATRVLRARKVGR